MEILYSTAYMQTLDPIRELGDLRPPGENPSPPSCQVFIESHWFTKFPKYIPDQ